LDFVADTAASTLKIDLVRRKYKAEGVKFTLAVDEKRLVD
jgi:hypothetical protein